MTKVGGEFRFEFDTQTGKTYVVQYTTSLTAANWQPLTTIVGDGTRKQVTDSAANAERFYRVATQ